MTSTALSLRLIRMAILAGKLVDHIELAVLSAIVGSDLNEVIGPDMVGVLGP